MTPNNKVVSHEQWVAARAAFLTREKQFTRARDELNRQRHELPWEAVEKDYVFDGPDGKETLAELFDGRSQLIVYHFMFAPDWDAGCPHCSFWADNFDPVIVHMNQRDVSMVADLARAVRTPSGLSRSAWAGRSSGFRPRARRSTSTTASRSPTTSASAARRSTTSARAIPACPSARA